MKNKFFKYLSLPLVLLATSACSSTGNKGKNGAQCIEWKKTNVHTQHNSHDMMPTLGAECLSKYNVYFESNEDKVEKKQLENIKSFVDSTKNIKSFVDSTKNINDKIIVVGHTDKNESDAEGLSMRRAKAVADQLSIHGIPKDRIKLINPGRKYATKDSDKSRVASIYVANENVVKCFNIRGLCKNGIPLLKDDSSLNRMIEEDEERIRDTQKEVEENAARWKKDSKEVMGESKKSKNGSNEWKKESDDVKEDGDRWKESNDRLEADRAKLKAHRDRMNAEEISRKESSNMMSTENHSFKPKCCPCPNDNMMSGKNQVMVKERIVKEKKQKPVRQEKERVIKEKVVKVRKEKPIKEPRIKKEKVVREQVIKEKKMKPIKQEKGNCKPCCEIKPAKAYDPETLVKPANCR